jgi:tetratricopeptide (TPR) repeat protein
MDTEGALADVHFKQQKYPQAEVGYRSLFDKLELTVGLEHKDTLRCLKRLTSALRKQKKTHDILDIYNKIISAYELKKENSVKEIKVTDGKDSQVGLGIPDSDNEDPSYILIIKTELYRVYKQIGDELCKENNWINAEEMYRCALPGNDEQTYDGLVKSLIQQDNLNEANEFYSTVLNRRLYTCVYTIFMYTICLLTSHHVY